MGNYCSTGYLATLGITFLGNFPLNKMIVNAEIPSTSEAWKQLRINFESRWILLNHFRTITCLGSIVA